MIRQHRKIFGLLGRKLGHSFSKPYFTQKFEDEGLDNFRYENFEIPAIGEFPNLWTAHPHLLGMNVTIPYKKAVIPYLDRLDPAAERVGAVNTIVRGREGLEGYNTDIIGFHASLRNLLGGDTVKGALILGTGGAARAVKFVLDSMRVPVLLVSRTPGENEIGYGALDEEVVMSHPLIVQTTPLGMPPHTGAMPPFPYHFLRPENVLFDLIYNPEKTLFLLEGERHGCRCQNGMEMLILQAEASWKIWNQYLH